MYEHASHVVVHTTVESHSEAEGLARELVEARLAACVQIVPVTSVYRWEGATETSCEFRLEIKTASAALEALKALILEKHSYEIPELVVLPIAGGSSQYLDWIERQSIADGTSENP